MNKHLEQRQKQNKNQIDSSRYCNYTDRSPTTHHTHFRKPKHTRIPFANKHDKKANILSSRRIYPFHTHPIHCIVHAKSFRHFQSNPITRRTNLIQFIQMGLDGILIPNQQICVLGTMYILARHTHPSITQTKAGKRINILCADFVIFVAVAVVFFLGNDEPTF